MSRRRGVEAVKEAAAELRQTIDAITHPLRLRLASELRLNPGQGAEELSAAVGEPVRRVRDQLKVLTDAGLVKVDREEKRRNVNKRFYVLAPEPIEIDAAATAELPEAMRARIVGGIFQAVIDDVLASLESGTFDRRPERPAMRIPARVDERGWDELVALYGKVQADAERIVAEASDRLGESGETGVPTSGSVFFFELPEIDAKNPE
jgi:DNA-binding transcriptional ArsR family regulator